MRRPGPSLGIALLLAQAPLAHAQGAWTSAERAYLAERGPVRVCADPAYPPFDFIDAQGRHRGIAADLLEEVRRATGLELTTVPTSGWTETLELARGGACDLVAMLNQTADRAEYLSFTRPYVTFDNAIVTHGPAYHRGLASLAGRSVALPSDYRLVELIQAEHPEITVLRVADTGAALRAVSRGEAYATLVNHQSLIRDVQRLGLRDLHFAGDAEVEDQYRIGVRRGDTLLLAIVDRALGAVPPAQLSRIMERWYVVPVEATTDWRLVLGVAGLGVGVLSLLLLHLYHRQRYYRLLERQNRELEQLSGTDALTGTSNRRRLDARLAGELERSRRYDRPLAVILFDVDGLKAVNDRHGHQAGDAVLARVAERAAACARSADIVGRWGGDEFLIVCPETDADAARILAERVGRAVAAGPAGEPAVTVSLGVAPLEEGDTPASILGRADAALYAAKSAGRDRTRVAGRAVGVG